MPPSSDWDTNYIMQSRRTFTDAQHEQADSRIKQMAATVSVFCTPSDCSAVQNNTVTQRQGHQHSQGHHLVSAAAANIPQAKRYRIPNGKEEQTVLLEGIFWFHLHHSLVISRTRPVPMQQAGPEKTVNHRLSCWKIPVKIIFASYSRFTFNMLSLHHRIAHSSQSTIPCFTSNSSQTSPLNQYQPAVSHLPLFPLRFPNWGFWFTSVLKANILQNQFSPTCTTLSICVFNTASALLPEYVCVLHEQVFVLCLCVFFLKVIAYIIDVDI